MLLPLRRVLVTGPSMVPALRHGDQLLVAMTARARRARPGRVVVVQLPGGPLAVKRLIRYDGDGVWVEGDNPFGSSDSRTLGALPADAVVGTVLLRLWPRPACIRTID